mmetsp:Transcript_5665/g.16240  ORF Transcript_5665/g.16240 Transcript_5665/m.16240 type:complete len:284 (-) Transcript_5665:625-1476(-)
MCSTQSDDRLREPIVEQVTLRPRQFPLRRNLPIVALLSQYYRAWTPYSREECSTVFHSIQHLLSRARYVEHLVGCPVPHQTHAWLHQSPRSNTKHNQYCSRSSSTLCAGVPKSCDEYEGHPERLQAPHDNFGTPTGPRRAGRDSPPHRDGLAQESLSEQSRHAGKFQSPSYSLSFSDKQCPNCEVLFRPGNDLARIVPAAHAGSLQRHPRLLRIHRVPNVLLPFHVWHEDCVPPPKRLPRPGHREQTCFCCELRASLSTLRCCHLRYWCCRVVDCTVCEGLLS